MLFYYVVSVICCMLIYFKLKSFNISESEKSVIHIVTFIPYINIILMLLIMLQYVDINDLDK